MRTVIVLCSMILMFSFTGIQAQTETVPVVGDSIQSPISDPPQVQETPIATEIPVMTAAQAMTKSGSLKNNGLTGTVLFSCNGLYFYNKSVESYPEYDYDWSTGTTIITEHETNYRTSMYSILLNANYFVTDGFSLGGTLGVLSMTYKWESDHEDYSYYYYDDGYSFSANLIGPRLAYYHGRKDSKVIPFAAFEYDLLTSDFYNDNAIRIGAGVLLQPRPHLGISFGLDYLKFGEEEKSTNIIGVLGLTGIIY
ncbi:MAG: hypothetical protein Q7U71_06510 [bacterium]|nr:hypothetical protein [bacterium]